MTDREFYTAISGIVAMHGCQVIEIDIDKRIINITGPSQDQEIECGDALEVFCEQNENITIIVDGVQQLSDKIGIVL